MNKAIRIFLVFVVICALFFVSEGVYVVNLMKNSDAFSDYVLRTAKPFAAAGAVDISFYILTKGEINLPSDQNFKTKVKDYLRTFPSNYDLKRVYYDLAVMSYYNGQKELTPNLLKLSVDNFPDSSFSQVELANYYLFVGKVDSGREVLEGCVKRKYPQRHCQEYLDSNFKNNQPDYPGFLREYVGSFY